MDIVQGIFSFYIVVVILTITHELGHFLFARLCGVKVETFSFGFGKELFGKTWNGTRYRFSLVPFGGYIKMKGMFLEDSQDADAFAMKKRWQRFLILFGGPLFNLLTMWVCLFSLSFFGEDVLTSRVKVLPNSPVAVAGMQDGDVVHTLDGNPVQNWDNVLEVLWQATQSNKEVQFRVLRHDKVLTFVVRPGMISHPRSGSANRVGFGVNAFGETREVKSGFFESVSKASSRFVWVCEQLGVMISSMKSGKMRARDAVGGPVAVYEVTSGALSRGRSFFLKILVSLSFSLALINLFPIPGLDGGHILLLGVEVIRRKQLSKNTYQKIIGVSVIFLFVMIYFITLKDLGCLGQ